MEQLELTVDVTDAAGLGDPATVAATVHLPSPDALGDTPLVCFAKPGGGFSHGYFTNGLPGPAAGSQAAWHAARGWVFVSVDHLGVGASSTHDTEAAAIEVPVLVGVGELDVVVDPKGEPRAYLSSPSVDLFVCPMMARMHNFAGTRELMWRRLDTWGAWLASQVRRA